MRTTYAAAVAALALALTACSGAADPAGPDSESGEVRVVTTFSLLGDLAGEIGGEHVQLHSMVPLGTDPHEYQPLPADIEAATKADLLVWNGLEMETGDGWFAGLVEVAGKDFEGPQVAEAAAGVEPQWLTDGDRKEVNPHAFLSPKAGLIYVDNITDALIEVDPTNAPVYQANAAQLRSKIEQIDARYTRELSAAATPVLVTSERAFQYVASDYGLLEGYLWEIDTDEQGTPAQITSLIRFIDEHQPRGLLVESNVDPRPMETVAAETGVPVAGEVYSDELGPAGSEGETYLGYLEYNLEAFLKAMGE